MTAWHDPFGERIKANVRRCDRCGTELDEGDNAYFTGLDMLCLDCAEAAARAQAEQDTVETIQTRFHAMIDTAGYRCPVRPIAGCDGR